jgi:thymidylate synthase
MTQIQILQTNKKMHLLAVFRSHDIFKAAIANAFGLLALQKLIDAKTDSVEGKEYIQPRDIAIMQTYLAN